MPNSTDTLDLFLRKSGDALACFSGTRLGCRMGWIALGRGLGQSAFNRVIGRHMGDRFAFTGISCFDVIGESGAGLTASHHTAAGRLLGERGNGFHFTSYTPVYRAVPRHKKGSGRLNPEPVEIYCVALRSRLLFWFRLFRFRGSWMRS